METKRIQDEMIDIEKRPVKSNVHGSGVPKEKKQKQWIKQILKIELKKTFLN